MTLELSDGTKEVYEEQNDKHRMETEFTLFFEKIKEGDYEHCYHMLEHSLLVSKLVTKARRDAGILFPTDTDNK